MVLSFFLFLSLSRSAFSFVHDGLFEKAAESKMMKGGNAVHSFPSFIQYSLGSHEMNSLGKYSKVKQRTHFMYFTSLFIQERNYTSSIFLPKKEEKAC